MSRLLGITGTTLLLAGLGGAQDAAKLPSESLPEGIEIKAQWTAYYITEVKQSVDAESGKTVLFTDLTGKRIRYHLTDGSFKRAEMEAVAVGLDKEGNERFAYRVKKGEWIELPEGSMGMGNRMNPLVPWVHVAADQKKYPYGSMIYVKDADGHETVDGTVLDGHFWVGDVGGAIKGTVRFDLFVGRDAVYSKVLDRSWKPTVPAVVYKLPKPPPGLDPKSKAGLRSILEGKGIPIPKDIPEDAALEKALIAFQKSQSRIPKAEYGNRRAATTLWFLTAAAREVADDQKAKKD